MSELMALTATGMSWELSARFWAVTITSSRILSWAAVVAENVTVEIARLRVVIKPGKEFLAENFIAVAFFNGRLLL
jgi:hypothetical protein